MCLISIIHILAFDFPQINYKNFNGKRYNFAYGVTMEKALADEADVCTFDNTNSSALL